MKTNVDIDLAYKVILDFAVSEIRAILKVIEPESLCFYLLTDTLKHVDTLVKEIKESPNV